MLTILTGDAIEQLRTLQDESVQCCVTSPPYWGLRDYGTAAWEGGDDDCDHKYSVSSPYNENFNERWGNASGAKKQESERHEVSYKSDCGKCGARRIDSQLGLEKTPEEYVAKMVAVFREVRRVLRKDGTLWLNLGDSYGHGTSADRQQSTNPGVGANCPEAQNSVGRNGLKPKDLIGIPWRVAFALQADGWWLRSDIIWAKPNPMPESVTDRPTKSHEYLFLLTKASSYFYDAEAIKEKAVEGLDLGILRSIKAANGQGPTDRASIDKRLATGIDIREGNPTGNRNKRSVWTVATAPYPEAHFATYPPDLIKPCIMAGTSAKGCCAKCGAPWERIVKTNNPSKEFNTGDDERYAGMKNMGGNHQTARTLGWQPTCKHQLGAGWMVEPCTVLDPFSGSGTTGMVALELGRKAVLIELNPKYCDLIRQRTNVTPGLQLA